MFWLTASMHWVIVQDSWATLKKHFVCWPRFYPALSSHGRNNFLSNDLWVFSGIPLSTHSHLPGYHFSWSTVYQICIKQFHWPTDEASEWLHVHYDMSVQRDQRVGQRTMLNLRETNLPSYHSLRTIYPTNKRCDNKERLWEIHLGSQWKLRFFASTTLLSNTSARFLSDIACCFHSPAD